MKAGKGKGKEKRMNNSVYGMEISEGDGQVEGAAHVAAV